MPRHTLDASSGFSPDGFFSTARAFNNKVPKNKPANRNRTLFHWLRWPAWLAGVVLAIIYLLWFFKNIFEHTVR